MRPVTSASSADFIGSAFAESCSAVFRARVPSIVTMRERRPHLLWSAADLADASLLVDEDFSASERDFVDASRRRARRTRALRWSAAAMVPALALGAYLAAVHAQRRAIDAEVATHMSAATAAHVAAKAAHEEMARLRAEAFAAFDTHDQERGEIVWQTARTRAGDAERAYATTSHELEGALTLDAARDEVLAPDADLRAGRHRVDRDARGRGPPGAARAVAVVQREARDALVPRVGSVQRVVEERALEEHVAEQRANIGAGRVQPSPARSLGASPVEADTEEAGSYLLEIDSPGRATTRLPFLAERGAQQKLVVDLRPATVPPGFVYIPTGVSLFGTYADEDARLGFFATVPAHPVKVPGFYVAQRETTWAAWIDFLRTLPAEERAARSPHVGPWQAVELRELPGNDWELRLTPIDQSFAARLGQPIVDARRRSRAERAWANLPVLGVSVEDVEAYTAWLRSTGRVPGARLCTEHEWERAARSSGGSVRKKSIQAAHVVSRCAT